MTGEIPERDARGDVAAIYADIRATLGVTMVNLVWRHLATRPAALPLCWGLVRPLYADGAAGVAAQRLRAALPWPPVARLVPGDLVAAGLVPATQATVRGLLAAYDHANPLNLLVLTALRVHLAGRSAGTGAAPRGAATTPAVAALDVPLLPAVAPQAMDAATRTRVFDLNAFGGPDAAPAGVLATVLRQLAAWPGLLERMHARIEPLMADGTATGLVEALRAAVGHESMQLAARLPAGVSVAEAAPIAAMLGPFIDGTLLRMVALVPLLRRTLGD